MLVYSSTLRFSILWKRMKQGEESWPSERIAEVTKKNFVNLFISFDLCKSLLPFKRSQRLKTWSVAWLLWCALSRNGTKEKLFTPGTPGDDHAYLEQDWLQISRLIFFICPSWNLSSNTALLSWQLFQTDLEIVVQFWKLSTLVEWVGENHERPGIHLKGFGWMTWNMPCSVRESPHSFILILFLGIITFQENRFHLLTGCSFVTC